MSILTTSASRKIGFFSRLILFDIFCSMNNRFSARKITSKLCLTCGILACVWSTFYHQQGGECSKRLLQLRWHCNKSAFDHHEQKKSTEPWKSSTEHPHTPFFLHLSKASLRKEDRGGYRLSPLKNPNKQKPS